MLLGIILHCVISCCSSNDIVHLFQVSCSLTRVLLHSSEAVAVRDRSYCLPIPGKRRHSILYLYHKHIYDFWGNSEPSRAGEGRRYRFRSSRISLRTSLLMQSQQSGQYRFVCIQEWFYFVKCFSDFNSFCPSSVSLVCFLRWFGNFNSEMTELIEQIHWFRKLLCETQWRSVRH